MRLGNLERSVMEALWSHPEGMFAQDLADGLASQPAVTTVLTVLVRLSRKGLVSRERQGRAHLYRAGADKDAFVAETMRAALDEAGDVEAAVSRFVGTVSPEVAAALREALDGRDEAAR
ncbi:BlaI/MecI/CopY family transcriptional regulator [Microbispora cellulosiformans]|uniref:BlaI/MecI/CopY family transcriptional regulator n=1 Tax=Microbispora cellulosiformans TaxID=2614688 RepID=A0A5J5K9C1_9ACTN|nr:BlaI/MecI/CopY family transcriptional regulator [Microbispora cellulosiformans]KAA9381417.1 BlaI/MecI/CopY family transcriptional regulator [Microbispora cellulosiformans]